ncbi:MAG TPA: NAD-dependent epimerase/dehydratase family protein [Vicinamibacterales bacterium]|jgi:2'-hydroxyisoflavone reductase|nr:NAD-dependent epimerase/dehydratase family protein [Vicinamibacterales bacterium]
MQLLILGGTKFLGPHLVDAALAAGHEVTLFNRGKNAPPRDGVESILGDRDGGLSVLDGRRWDAVIDTCGFAPRVVRTSVEALRSRVGQYAFVSTISVYPETFGGGFDEAEPVMRLEDPSVEVVTPETYGGLKALCEGEVIAGMGARALIVRPGLIVGPLDPSDRFTYWPHRFAMGGDVLVPGSRDTHVSFIDARDLAQWIIASAESGLTGTFNASGLYGATTMGAVIDACAAAADSGTPVWVGESFLVGSGVTPWTELPLWIPQGEDNIVKASSARAVAAGLSFRPLAETVRATLDWTKRLGLERALRAGLSRERESELLAQWKSAAG